MYVERGWNESVIYTRNHFRDMSADVLSFLEYCQISILRADRKVHAWLALVLLSDHSSSRPSLCNFRAPVPVSTSSNVHILVSDESRG
jgi:hypothetical protein